MISILPVLAIALAPTLNLALDCGAIPDDGVDDTPAFNTCLSLNPDEIVIPPGQFLVDRAASNQAGAVNVHSGVVFTGHGPASRVRLIRDENGFSGARVFAVTAKYGDVSHAVFRNMTIDGGREGTCLESKHTPGGPLDGRGQQQHGIFVGGADGMYVRNFEVENVVFENMTGDALYFYNNVENVVVEGQTIGGWCRAGIAFNAYEHCDQHFDPDAWDEMEQARLSKDINHVVRPFEQGIQPQGLRNIHISKNTFVSDPTATEGARALDAEPNSYICDLSFTENRLDQIEAGGIIRAKIEGNTLARTGTQPGGNIALVGVFDAVIRGNTVLMESSNSPALYLRVMENTLVEGNFVQVFSDEPAVQVSHNGNKYSRNTVIRNNRFTYRGDGPSPTAAVYLLGTDGRVDVVGNEFYGFRDAISLQTGDDALVEGNYWEVPQRGILVRAVTGPRSVGNLTIRDNRGTADIAYWIQGAISGELRDCGGSTTGRRLPTENPLTSCNPYLDELSDRIDALEAAIE